VSCAFGSNEDSIPTLHAAVQDTLLGIDYVGGPNRNLGAVMPRVHGIKRRLIILTEIISPYRIPLFNALAQHEEVDLHVIFLAETDPTLRQWQVYKEEIQFSYQVLASWRKRIGRYNVLLNGGVCRALAASEPDVILCGGYNYIASWQALLWAESRKIPLFLWSESTQQDQRGGNALIELMKKDFLSRCRGFVVPGRSAEDYLQALKVDAGRIFAAPNAVDNDLFSRAAAVARQNSAAYRAKLNLPARYFLFVGRIERDKGVFELLSAYAALNESICRQIGLVFVGDGASRRELELAAAGIAPGSIRFAGFAQRDELATYYALADMLILPTYSDAWGLVVNEAMSSGLPVILSQAAGCAADLVRENWNGSLISPRDVVSLTSAMQRLASQSDLRAEMGINSSQHISHYSPGEWSRGVARMVEAGCA
jgi:1,2-diacylglycerol 3-alpha-glucosyltransferase